MPTILCRYFLAAFFGLVESEVIATATAVLQRPTAIRPGADILPFALPAAAWRNCQPDSPLLMRADGKLINT